MSRIQKISKGEKKFRDLFNASPDAIFIESLDGIILDVNELACEMHGLSYDKLVGKHFLDFVPDNHKEKVADNFQTFVTDQVKTLESFTTTANGKTIPIELKVSRIEFEGKESVLIHVRNITKRWYAEQELMKSNFQLQNLSKLLHNAREAQSMKIARELHDDLGQKLTALKIDLALIDMKLRKNEQIEDVLDKSKSILELASSCMDTLRQISTNLRPTILDNLGLKQALEWHIGDFEKRHKIVCALNLNADSESFSKEIQTTVFRIIQEGLNNVSKHSQATKAEIIVEDIDSKIKIRIEDNGTGFLESEISNQSFGILGIKERVMAFGGEFNLISDNGTVVQAIIPKN